MCGIVGLWNVSTANPGAAARAMLEAMKHRGPDGQGTLEYAGGAAGMVRLALVDLSERGQQPLWSEDRKVAILFNGEIYNFRSERARLESAGYRFHSTTDTEVLLNLYLERGLDFHERARGMYALAIFDWRQSPPGGAPVVTLARDPLGIKHLYIAHPHGDSKQLIFASEIRSLLASGLVPAEICQESLANYLTHGFVVQPGTMIRGVRTMEPGTLERYAPGEPMTRRKIWSIPEYQPARETIDQAAERLRAVLEESVALHAMADAPVGAFLSGGIDSTGVVALMRKHIGQLRTYTLQFPDVRADDEVREAVSAAQRFDCQHTIVDITSRDVALALPQFAGDIDQPSADGFNTWLISRAAARDVKGVLSGLGGDEWFAGYPVTRRMARYDTTAGGQTQSMAGHVAERLAPWIPQGWLRERAENLATRRSALATWIQGHTVFHHRLARRMAGLSAGTSPEPRMLEIIGRDTSDWQRETPIGLSCLLDARVYMSHQLLRDSDAASMAHSLELRVPFVDIHLADFSRGCADEFKLRADGGSSSEYQQSGAKRVLIHALRDLLPESIADRPKKGFALPNVHWMKGAVAPLAEDTCCRESIRNRGLVDPDLVERVQRDAQSGGSALFPRLWTLMILELWCRAVIDKYSTTPAHRQPISV